VGARQVTDLQLLAVSHRSKYTKEQAMDSQLSPTSACQMNQNIVKTNWFKIHAHEVKNTVE